MKTTASFRQLSLFDLNIAFNEPLTDPGVPATALVTPPPPIRWDWEAPFLHECGRVWVPELAPQGFRYSNVWRLLFPDDPYAEAFRREMEDYKRHGSHIFDLISMSLPWYLASPYAHISVPGFVDVGDLPADYIVWEKGDAAEELVPMKHIIPTQEKLLKAVVENYTAGLPTHSLNTGRLPLGIRFAGSADVYLIDGHHRWYVSKKDRKMNVLRMEVMSYDMTFEQALGCIMLEDSPDDEMLADVLEQALSILRGVDYV